VTEIETVAIVVCVSVVVLAAVSAWLTSRIEANEQPLHRKLLQRTRSYREHLARRRGRPL
jgi:regulation of enolase protein 1 (concanavalin A-like superfamily)